MVQDKNLHLIFFQQSVPRAFGDAGRRDSRRFQGHPQNFPAAVRWRGRSEENGGARQRPGHQLDARLRGQARLHGAQGPRVPRYLLPHAHDLRGVPQAHVEHVQAAARPRMQA